ncbi:hypothetical protein AB6A40_011169 [Gnathostoma spinigerum]|uniref:Uncharacterized protein n=1 Tax=Gnathostoma spinigerum TaxID=75299 RepID=A0ABD6EYD7_9BILA
MLHFPGDIAAPAFSSLKQDIQEGGSRYNFTDVIVISKIRIRDVDVKVLPVNPHEGRLKKGRKKKMGKAAKKRAAAAALAEADVIYDNSEEALLYRDPLNCPYFQYPVQSEIERESKFSIITINGVNYRPFRRVSVLDREQFTVFVNLVSNS